MIMMYISYNIAKREMIQEEVIETHPRDKIKWASWCFERCSRNLPESHSFPPVLK